MNTHVAFHLIIPLWKNALYLMLVQFIGLGFNFVARVGEEIALLSFEEIYKTTIMLRYSWDYVYTYKKKVKYKQHRPT